MSEPPVVGEVADDAPVPERADGDSTSEGLDLRILTPGLAAEEIAAVTSVVSAMLEEQRDAAERDAAGPEAHWRGAVEPVAAPRRGAAAWRRSLS